MFKKTMEILFVAVLFFAPFLMSGCAVDVRKGQGSLVSMKLFEGPLGFSTAVGNPADMVAEKKVIETGGVSSEMVSHGSENDVVQHRLIRNY